MPEITYPSAVDLVELRYALWSPRQEVYRFSDSQSSLSSAYTPSFPRWRGGVTFRGYSAVASDERDIEDALRAFLSALSRPDNWTRLPWARADATTGPRASARVFTVTSVTSGVYRLTPDVTTSVPAQDRPLARKGRTSL